MRFSWITVSMESVQAAMTLFRLDPSIFQPTATLYCFDSFILWCPVPGVARVAPHRRPVVCPQRA